jgi:uncharacterized protein
MQIKTLRRWNNAIHRDVGYLCVGMTLIYAISGIVLNHFKSGDLIHPDYAKSFREFKVPLPKGGLVTQTYVFSILENIGEKDHFKSYIMGTNSLEIFLSMGSVYIDLQNGDAQLEKKTPLYGIREFNLLHYNNIKKFYTWFSDLYAVGLIFLAITGLFILKGRNGILGRGAWLTAMGILLPALFILFYA